MAIDELSAEITPMAVGTTTITVALADNPTICGTCKIEVIDASDIAAIFAESNGAPISICDLHGRVIKLCTAEKELQDIAPGIYIIRRGSISKKVLIK